MDEIEMMRQVLQEIKLRIGNMNLRQLEIKLDYLLDNKLEQEDINWVGNSTYSDLSNDNILDTFIETIGHYSGAIIIAIIQQKFMLCSKIKKCMEIEYDEMLRIIYQLKKNNSHDVEDLEEEVREIWIMNKNYIERIISVIYE